MFDLIVGPSSVGKSTYYDALTNAQHSAHKPGPIVFAHSVRWRIPDNIVLHYNMLKPFLHMSSQELELKGWNFLADPVFKRIVQNAKRIRKAWILVSGLEDLLKRMRERTHVERGSAVDYNSDYWANVLQRLDLFQLYERLFDHFDAAGIAYDVVYSSTDAVDGFAPSDRVFCHYNLRGKWFPVPEAEEIRSVRGLRGCEYQTVLLPRGERTDRRGYSHLGVARNATFEKILTMSCQNKSFLDIGCANGELLFKAERLGATRLVGVDVNRDRFEAAQAVADLIRSRVQIIHADFMDLPVETTFDFVFALNVLHHIEDIYGFLRKLARLASQSIYIEFPTMSDPIYRGYRCPLAAWRLNRAPVMGVSSSRKGQTFVFSPRALIRIVMENIGGFSTWQLQKSPIKGRKILVFTKTL